MRNRNLVFILIVLLLAACSAPADSTEEALGDEITEAVATETPLATDAPPTETPVPTDIPVTEGPTEVPTLADPVTFADPCNLLTVGEIEAQIGALTDEPTLLSSETPERADPQDCRYTASSNQLLVSVARYYEHIGAESDFVLRRSANAEPVAGLGFDAFYVESGGPSLHVLGNLDILMISIRVESGDPLNAATILARTALGRLENGTSASVGSDTGSDAPDFEPCDAMTEDQAAGILGTLTSPPQPGAAVGESVGEFLTCIYSGEMDSAFLSFRHFSSAQNARAYYDNALASAGDAEELFGYGDAGFVRDGGRSLTALRGTLVLSVQSGLREHSEGVAATALVRIP